jgi:DNA-binding HxlR family transcriptional regulator
MASIEDYADYCPQYHHAIELIGKRWTGVILLAMMAGRTRYADLRDAVPELSETMLRQRLRELEAEAILTRHVSTDTPVRVDYRLTAKGRALQTAIEAVSAWADDWVEPPADRGAPGAGHATQASAEHTGG